MKSNKGFTILELLISLAITSMVMLSFFTVINSSIRSNSKNESDIKALHVAQSEIENLRQQIKSGNDNETKLIVADKSIEFVNNIGKVDGEQDILYKKEIGDKTYLLKLNIIREDVKNYEGYLYDIDIQSELYNKKKDEAEKYISKKETKLATKILSNNKSKAENTIEDKEKFKESKLFDNLSVISNIVFGKEIELYV